MSLKSFLAQIRRSLPQGDDAPFLSLNLERNEPEPNRHSDVLPVKCDPVKAPHAWQLDNFRKYGEQRIGTVGALLENRKAFLFCVEEYSCDAWGVTISVMHVPMPGFSTPRASSPKLGCIWDWFSTNEERWQARHCFKFLFGADQIQTVSPQEPKHTLVARF